MIKPDLICRDNVLMPGQLQFVHPETGALIATVNANTPEDIELAERLIGEAEEEN